VLHQINLTHGVHNRISGVRAGGAGDESAATNTVICYLGNPWKSFGKKFWISWEY